MKKKFCCIGYLLVFCFFSCTMTGRDGQNVGQQPRRTGHRYTQPKDEGYMQTESHPLPQQNSGQEMSATEIFRRYNSAVFMVFTSDGIRGYQGSGFFISKDGLAVSNYHVFEGTAIGYEIIKLSNGKQYKVDKILARSKKDDYILFRVKGQFNYIPVSYRRCEVGEKVYTIGSPRGLENTFSSGEISQIREDNFIQISCPIDHGSSGGALINAYGEAIGITTAGYDTSGANLNFAKSIKVIPLTKQ